jgi:hypothetical protein
MANYPSPALPRPLLRRSNEDRAGDPGEPGNARSAGGA